MKRGATGSFTASFGGGNAVAGALGNQTALEMRNGAEDVENPFARSRCGVDSFFEADQVNAADLEAFDGIEQFFEGAAEAIETGNAEAIGIPAAPWTVQLLGGSWIPGGRRRWPGGSPGH